MDVGWLNNAAVPTRPADGPSQAEPRLPWCAWDLLLQLADRGACLCRLAQEPRLETAQTKQGCITFLCKCGAGLRVGQTVPVYNTAGKCENRDGMQDRLDWEHQPVHINPGTGACPGCARLQHPTAWSENEVRPRQAVTVTSIHKTNVRGCKPSRRAMGLPCWVIASSSEHESGAWGVVQSRLWRATCEWYYIIILLLLLGWEPGWASDCIHWTMHEPKEVHVGWALL